MFISIIHQLVVMVAENLEERTNDYVGRYHVHRSSVVPTVLLAIPTLGCAVTFGVATLLHYTGKINLPQVVNQVYQMAENLYHYIP